MFRHLPFALLALGGCVAFDEAGAPPAEPDLATRLLDREQLVLEPPSLVGVAAYDRDGNSLPCVQPDVLAGEAIVRSTESGLLLVEKLVVDLSDVEIRAGVVGEAPVGFTDLELRLGTQLVVEPAWADRSASGTGRADLLLDWAVRTDGGEVYPLATQLVRDVEFAVEARLGDDGRVTASATAAIDGPVWDFERVRLEDLSMDVHAGTAATAQ